ncbi:MAG: Gldg family protein [Gemmatimonadetes bacterium]|nr:Gldg family protein [Gemmatimonadota bacterium]
MHRTGAGAAMNRFWPTWLLLAGLVAVFAGARVFDGVAVLNLPLIVAGVAAVLAAAGARFAAWRKADGDRRSIEAVFAFGSAGCVIALIGFFPGTDGGIEALGMDFEGIREQLRFQRFFLVSSPILLACSLLPVLAAQWAVARGGSAGALKVDALRVRETAANILSLALAGSALVLIGYVASALNRTADFSYFKTSRPGEAVQEIVRGMDGTLTAAVFFPEVNSVRDEVLNYLRELERVTGNVVIEEYDRYADPVAAADYNARNDGEIFLRVDSRTEQIGFLLNLNEARGRLRIMDSHVQRALLQLTRQRRVAYLTTGHGELNDPLASDEEEQPPDPRELWRPGQSELDDGPPPRALRDMLSFLNYEVRDIGVRRGLGDRIPDDAAMVMILGPQRSFLEAEKNAIREYLDRGGSLLVALEPGTDFRLEEFRDRLGVDHDPSMTVDDEVHVTVTNTISDRQWIITNRFSTHPSVTTASRRGVNQGIVMIGPGRIRVAEDVEGLRTTLTINSYRSSYLDLNGNFRFDEDTEVRESHGLAAAIERVGDTASMRALVYADAQIFEDAILTSSQLQASLVGDGIRWLGQEEAFSGEVVSEEDVPIVHTRSENVVWFYAIIFGAPALVLGLGVANLYGRRGKVEAA